MNFRRDAGPVSDLDQLWRISLEYFDRVEEREIA